MTAYIVAYDLNQETRRPNIVAEVKRTPVRNFYLRYC